MDLFKWAMNKPRSSFAKFRMRKQTEISAVVHIITTLEKGGAENQLLVLAASQIKNGFSVTVIFLKGKRDLLDEFQRKGAVVIDLTSTNSVLRQILSVRKALPGKLHILHAHLPQAELIGRFARRKSSRFVISRHYAGQFYPERNQTLSKMLSWLASGPAEAVIAISDAVKQNLIINSEVRNHKKISRIYYGFDCSTFMFNHQGVGRVESQKLNVIRIGTIARLADEKDYPTLLKGFKKLLEDIPDAILEIAGSGPFQSKLEELSNQLGIGDKIIWRGKLPDVRDMLQTLDVFVLASKFEGFGMVLLEAMCMNRRIVAAGNSAILEVLGANGAGNFFETGKPDELATQIIKVLKVDLDTIAEAQKAQLRKFSVDELSFETTQLYSKILPSNHFALK
jgi:glycosyltransferase involved in cell wall biosynthesis